MAATTLPTSSPLRTWTLGSVFARTIAERSLLVSMSAAGLFLMNVWMGPLYNSLEDSLAEMAASLGDAMTSMFGDMATPEGWLSAEIYSLVAPGLVIYVAIASAARAFATEAEERSIGLLAANPLSRRAIAAQKSAAMVCNVSVVAVLCGLGTWVGIQLGGLGIPAGHVAAISLHLLLLGVVVGLATVIAAVLVPRARIAMAIGGALALVAYTWGSFVPLSDSLEGLAVLSPWHWYYGSEPLTNGVDWGYVGLFVALGAILAAVAVYLFDRRDLPG